MAQGIKKQYGNRLRECRLRAMVATQRELAKMTEISSITIHALENNKLFLPSYCAMLIAETLGWSLDDLYEKRQPKSSL